MRRQAAAPYPQGILVDQGLADKFLAEQLHTTRGLRSRLRRRRGSR
jgi:S-formylglutathione hydrolase